MAARFRLKETCNLECGNSLTAFSSAAAQLSRQCVLLEERICHVAEGQGW